MTICTSAGGLQWGRDDSSAPGGLIVTLLDHLRQEDWTPTIPLIDRALCAGVRIRHIPAPSGHANWLEEDYEELLAEFLAAGRGPARLVQLAIDAVDDQHLRGLLDKTVKWFLADRARRPAPKTAPDSADDPRPNANGDCR